MKGFIIGNELMLSSSVLSSAPVKIEISAILPNNDFNGMSIEIHDWLGDGSNTCFVSYSLDSRMNATIHNCFFPVKIEKIPLTPPKGKGWKWGFGKWERYTKTRFEEREAF